MCLGKSVTLFTRKTLLLDFTKDKVIFVIV